MIYLILVHGCGGTGAERIQRLKEIILKTYQDRSFYDVAKSLGITCNAPTAPIKPYSASHGKMRHIWFDRSKNAFKLGRDCPEEDLAGIEESLEQILGVIRDVPPEFQHIFIAGLSMGGGLSLHLLRKSLPERVRGIFTFGSFAVKTSALFTAPLGDGARVPVLMTHGTSDEKIELSWGQGTAADLTARGVAVDFRSYKGHGHSAESEEMRDLLGWILELANRISPPPVPPLPLITTTTDCTTSSMKVSIPTSISPLHTSFGKVNVS